MPRANQMSEGRKAGRIVADQVPGDSAGSREIGFKISERYNASRVLFYNLVKAEAIGKSSTLP